MKKLQKLAQKEERRERTLNVFLSQTVKDIKDIESLFVGNFHVKLPRQSSRSCHVVFSSVEEKIKNYKLAKNKRINGKRIFIKLHPVELNKKTKKDKEVSIPEIKSDLKMTQTIFVSNIANGTKSHEVLSVIPGCISVTLLKSYNQNFKSAIIKMASIQAATDFLKKKSLWPVLKGHTLRFNPDTRKRHKKKVSILKIYDTTVTKDCKSIESL